jgi:hypothetical protein
MQHRAIETRYKGYRFRSRLEARWAVFFDALGLRWEYEPEGFELPSGRYLPDFYAAERHPDGGFRYGPWVEVKAVDPTAAEMQRMRELCAATDCHGLIVVGLPDAQRWVHFHKEGRADDDTLTALRPCTPVWERLGVDWREYGIAAIAARCARFEFGESGARA